MAGLKNLRRARPDFHTHDVKRAHSVTKPFNRSNLLDLESNLDIDGPARRVDRAPARQRDRRPSGPENLSNFLGDTSDLNIDGAPSFTTTSLSDIYLNFSTNTQTDIETSTDSVGGGFSLNFNNLFQAAMGNPQSLSDIFSLGNTKIMTTSEFANASLYYIDSNFGDVLAVDATLNKFGRLEENFNELADKVGLPGVKIPNVSLSKNIGDLNPFNNLDLIYQNQVFELFNASAPTDSDAGPVDRNGEFFGVPQFNNPYRGVAFQVLGDTNKTGDVIDLSYQGQVVNLAELEIQNPIAAWRSGDIKFKPIELPKIKITGDLPGFPPFTPPKFSFPDLPEFDLPKFPDLNLPRLNLPDINLPKLNLPDINLPNISLPNIDFPDIKFTLMDDFINAVRKLKFPDVDLPDIPNLSGFGNFLKKLKLDIDFPDLPNINLPNVNLPNLNLPNIDLSGVGSALKNAGEFLGDAASSVGSAIGDAANIVGNAAGAVGDAIGSVVDPAKDFLSKIKISPFKMNGQVDWGSLGIAVEAGNLNPIESIKLPALDLQNPFKVNTTEFGGVGVITGNTPRSSVLLKGHTVKKRRGTPNVPIEYFAENVPVQDTPYSELGKLKYGNLPVNYYPALLSSPQGDEHTTAPLTSNLHHLNHGYSLNGTSTNKIEAQAYGMPFYFYDLRDNTYITFRAYIEALTEQVSPSWSPQNYVGRSEPVYIYERTERGIDFTLKLFAGNEQELDAIYSKMRRLTSLCYPEYKMDAIHILNKTRMKPPMTRLRIGELYGSATSHDEANNMPSKNDVLGFVKSLSYSVPESSPWEYRAGQRVPKHVIVTISYQVVHDRPPNKNTSFYGYEGSMEAGVNQ